MNSNFHKAKYSISHVLIYVQTDFQIQYTFIYISVLVTGTHKGRIAHFIRKKNPQCIQILVMTSLCTFVVLYICVYCINASI